MNTEKGRNWEKVSLTTTAQYMPKWPVSTVGPWPQIVLPNCALLWS